MIRTTVNVEGAITKLTKGSAALATLRSEVFPRLKGPLRDDQRDHAKSEESPDGKWPKRSDSSVVQAFRYKNKETKKWVSGFRRRKSNRGKLLGRLGNATQVRTRGLSVYARSMVRWAAIHQDGGVANRGAKIPARAFLWISDDLAEGAARMIEQHITEAMNKS